MEVVDGLEREKERKGKTKEKKRKRKFEGIESDWERRRKLFLPFLSITVAVEKLTK